MNAVLVVDDDPDVLQFISTTLTRGGVKAIAAHSGEDAIRIFRRRHSEIRLLLTDIAMPQITGIQLSAAIAALDPKLRVVFMTGYKTDHVEQFGPALQGHEILGKPFTPAELLQVVGKALDRTATSIPPPQISVASGIE